MVITIDIDQDLLKHLQDLANKQGSTINHLVNQALKEYILNHKELYFD